MANIVDFINNKLKPYYFYIMVLVIALLFIIIGIYAFKRFNKTVKNDKYSDVANTGSVGNVIDVYLFHVDWCPHCKKALPEWQSFCDEYNKKNINGYTIHCDRDGLDCTNESDAKINSLISEYKIESYPTVIIMKENKRYDFDAKISKSSLEQFVQYVTTA